MKTVLLESGRSGGIPRPSFDKPRDLQVARESMSTSSAETGEEAVEGGRKDPSLGQPVLSSDDRGLQADPVISTPLGAGSSSDDEHVVVEKSAVMDEPDAITHAVRRDWMGTCGGSFACSWQSVGWVLLPPSARQLFFALPRPERGLEPPETRGDRLDLPDTRDAEIPDGASKDPSDEQHVLNRSYQETQADPTESTHRAGSSTEAQRLEVELATLSDEGDTPTRANDAQRQGVEAAVGDVAAPAVTRQVCDRTLGSCMCMLLLLSFSCVRLSSCISHVPECSWHWTQNQMMCVVGVFSSLPFGTRTVLHQSILVPIAVQRHNSPSHSTSKNDAFRREQLFFALSIGLCSDRRLLTTAMMCPTWCRHTRVCH